jgi:hypothetical protein
MSGIEKMKKMQAVTSFAVVVTLAFLVTGFFVGGTISLATLSQPVSAQSFINQEGDLKPEPKAPMTASEDGNNIYVVWWTNRSGNWEVMFRASNDGGATFGDKINLSNSTDAESQTAEILAVGEDSVFVSWWETSPETGSSESVLRVSTDGGETFGPVIMLGMNGTISTAANTAGAAEGEAVGGAEE